ncbi:MAG: hypothetical protein ACRDNO_27195 [Trebonia sp.]
MRAVDGPVDGPGDFARPVSWLAALCRGGIDAVVGVIAASADGIAAACWPLRLA